MIIKMTNITTIINKSAQKYNKNDKDHSHYNSEINHNHHHSITNYNKNEKYRHYPSITT